MRENASNADPLGEIAEEFASEVRAGRKPTIDDFAHRYPDHADEIREILPMMVLMDNVKQIDEQDEAVAQAEEDETSLVGRTLGDYLVIREIGRGGMGVVYEAEQISLGRIVALKVLPHNFLPDARQRVRFEREAKAAAGLHHTNIVPVFGVGSQDGIHYFVMQFIRGLGLDEVLHELKRLQFESKHTAGAKRQSKRSSRKSRMVPRRESSNGKHKKQDQASSDSSLGSSSGERCESLNQVFSDVFAISDSPKLDLSGHDSSDSSGETSYWQSIAKIGLQVAEALQYAHDQGVTHRDIKPANLLLDLNGSVYVTDFGLAKSDDQQNITHSGDLLGTLRYMPPEAFEGESDGRSDVYSLGITLYEFLMMSAAFEDIDRHQLIKKITQGDVRPLHSDVPRDLATIIDKTIERAPGDRYQSGKDLAEDLRRFIRDEPILARRPTAIERSLRWSRQNRGLATSLLGIAALLVVISASASLAAVYYHEQEEVQRLLYKQTNALALRNQELLDDNREALSTALETSLERDLARKLAQQKERETRQNLYFSQMAIGNEMLNQHRGLAKTRELINRWRPEEGEHDYRGWEWYFINARQSREEFALEGHTGDVTGLSWSPDGAFVASASRDGSVRIWDVGLREEHLILRTPFKSAICVAWSRAGDRIAAGGDNGFVVCDARSGDVTVHKSKGRAVYGIAWSDKDEQLAAAIKQMGNPSAARKPATGSGRSGEKVPGEMRVFQTEDWSPRLRIVNTQIGFYNAAISWKPGESRLAIPAGTRIAIWDSHERKRERFLHDHTESVQAVAFNPNDGNLLASTSRDSTIKIWDFAEGTVDTELIGHTHGVSAVAWHPDNERLASASWDGTARIWDLQSGQQIARLNGHPTHCLALCWNPSGDLLATAGDDHLIKFWSSQIRTHDYRLLDLPNSRRASFCPRGDLLCSILDSGEIAVWDLTYDQRLADLEVEGSAARNTCFDPNGEELATVHADHIVRIWDARSSELVRSFETDHSGLRRVTWSPDGNRIATTNGTGVVYVINAWNGQPIAEIGEAGGATVAIKWNPDSSHLAIASRREAQVWKVSESEPSQIAITTHVRTIRDIDWSSDGSRLASASADTSIRIWNWKSGETERVFTGHNEVVQTIRWGPQDRRLMSADSRGGIIIWDVDTGQQTLTFRGGVGRLTSADWSADGMRVITNCSGRLQLWDATKGFETR